MRSEHLYFLIESPGIPDLEGSAVHEDDQWCIAARIARHRQVTIKCLPVPCLDADRTHLRHLLGLDPWPFVHQWRQSTRRRFQKIVAARITIAGDMDDHETPVPGDAGGPHDLARK